MKKQLLLSIFIVIVSTTIAFSQFNLVGTLPLGNNGIQPVTSQGFEFIGTKYVRTDISTNTITLYNLDLSVYKVINVPPQPFGYYVRHISETLFDNDSSN